MTLASLIADLQARGARLAASGNRLRIEAPHGLLTPELLERLRTHKAAVLAALSDPRIAGLTPLLRPGWTRSAWVSNLRRLAARCEDLRPDRAAELRAEAHALERDPKLNGPWPAEYSFRAYEAWEQEAFRSADQRQRRDGPRLN